MSVNIWIKMWYINNGILSHKNEYIWVSPSEVYNPRACYTEGSKSERNILLHTHTHTHTHGNLQEWCWHAYLQNRNIEKDTDLWTQQGKKRVGQAEEHWNLWLCVRQTAKGGAVYHRELRELSLVLCDNQQRWGGVEGGRAVSQEGTYVYLWLILNCYRRNQHGKAIILQFQRTRVAE